MSWRDHIHLGGKGSFRGVEFSVEDTTGNIGRRVTVHEYPGRDKPYAKDHGKKARSYSFRAFVAGENYHTIRDDMIKALEKPGPGTLIHPFLGRLRVVVESASFAESLKGGWARFDLSFKESGEEPSPFISSDTAAALREAATSAVDSVKLEFSEQFTLTGMIQDVRDSANDTIQGMVDKLRDTRTKIDSALGVVSDAASAIDEFDGLISDLLDVPNQLADEFAGIVGDVVGALSDLGDSADALVSRFRISTTLEVAQDQDSFGDTVPIPPNTTPQRIQERENRRQIVQLNDVASVSECSRVLADLEFDSVDQAREAQDQIVEIIDGILENTEGSDGVYQEMIALKASLVSHMEETASTLPELTEYTPRQSTPTIVIAHELYGDPERAEDIVQRNDVKNPLSAPGGVPLNVLYE